ncbi:PilZ domain-containing protein [Desulfobulbus oligotrophicus]|jgi:hypothetical protein|uniref:PilZ domain-containing protein n=1 Tax=Desulfobulbus oligotrophicus TaxID=1909699 RepID=A0A7T6ARL9_9BACT|nr:PilZ domain-containing protein [Desulfobulbus oligotrophicus]MDY0391388.1 PilZ domain-containing protein [Desulfobulbus oligotrophicus]QQG66667.1 PilZ domain-containing protein [Desulfobulbus oligotrophicus]
MFVFGSKCPSCRGTDVTARPAASGFAWLPVIRSYGCTRCRQQFFTFFFVSISREHRRFPRKHLPAFFLARISGKDQQYARIKNISEDGISFDQHYNAPPLGSNELTVDLYNCNDGSSLEQLPTEILAITEYLLDTNGIKTTVLNYSCRFTNLTQAQKKVLRSCLNQFGT